MDMETMKAHNATTEILANPDSTAVRRTALQVLATPEGLVFRFIYIKAMYDDAHIAKFRQLLEKWIDKIGATINYL